MPLPRRPRAILFDFNGILVDDEPLHGELFETHMAITVARRGRAAVEFTAFVPLRRLRPELGLGEVVGQSLKLALLFGHHASYR